MNPNREELIFGLAVTKAGPSAPSFSTVNVLVIQHCAPALKRCWRRMNKPKGCLLKNHPAAAGTMKIEFTDVPDEAVGQTLGRYKLLERVGEGGCGVVYVAEQTEPVRRRVALKVIKLGMDTKQVVARFEAERQALAMMDHPNIAKVLDAGTTGASDQSSVTSDQSPEGGSREARRGWMRERRNPWERRHPCRRIE